MKVELLGTGTSQGIPVIGCDCRVCKSENARDKRLRCAVHIETETTSIIIDTGPDFRYQMLRAGIEEVDAVLITHEHNDHIAGLDDIRPFNFKQKQPMDLYALPRVAEVIKNKFDYIFEEVPYPGAPRVNLYDIDDSAIIVNDVEVQPLHVMHGDLPVVGFRFGKFAYITDAKVVPDDTINKIKDIDVLVLNALRHDEHHSHFNLEQAIAFGEKLGVDQLYLTHISHLMGKYEEIQKSLPNRVDLAHDGLEITL